MSYGIVRVQKMTKGSVRGIQIHDLREKEGISHTNKDIDWKRTSENFDLHNQQNQIFYKAVKERIEKLDLKKAVRKDAVVLAQCLVTSDHKFFKNKTYNETKEFFQDSYNFLAERYGADNVVSSIVHMDERTPHMHFNFVPVTTDGRLSAKSILNRVDLIKQHDDFYKEIGKKYGLERGERNSDNVHLETADYKKQTINKEVEWLQIQKNNLENNLNRLENDMNTYTKQQGCLHDLEQIEIKKSLTGSKITLSKEDYDKLHYNAVNGFKAEHNLVETNKALKSNYENMKISYEDMKEKYKPLEKDNMTLKKDLRDARKKIMEVIETFKENPKLKQDYHETRKLIGTKKEIENQTLHQNSNDYEMER